MNRKEIECANFLIEEIEELESQVKMLDRWSFPLNVLKKYGIGFKNTLGENGWHNCFVLDDADRLVLVDHKRKRIKELEERLENLGGSR